MLDEERDQLGWAVSVHGGVDGRGRLAFVKP
jgi:hypothetical protein